MKPRKLIFLTIWTTFLRLKLYAGLGERLHTQEPPLVIVPTPNTTVTALTGTTRFFVSSSTNPLVGTSGIKLLSRGRSSPVSSLPSSQLQSNAESPISGRKSESLEVLSAGKNVAQIGKLQTVTNPAAAQNTSTGSITTNTTVRISTGPQTIISLNKSIIETNPHIQTVYDNIWKLPTDLRLFKGIKLKNGLKFVLIQSHEVFIPIFHMTITSGFQSDPTELQGLSQLQEHLILTGSKAYPSDLVTYTNARGGKINTMTTHDRIVLAGEFEDTIYFDIVERIRDAVRCPLFRKEWLERELREISGEFLERKYDYEKLNLLLHLLVNENHSGRKRGIGSEPVMNRLREKGVEHLRAQLAVLTGREFIGPKIQIIVATNGTIEQFFENYRFLNMWADIPMKPLTTMKQFSNFVKCANLDRNQVRRALKEQRKEFIINAVQNTRPPVFPTFNSDRRRILISFVRSTVAKPTVSLVFPIEGSGKCITNMVRLIYTILRNTQFHKYFAEIPFWQRRPQVSLAIIEQTLASHVSLLDIEFLLNTSFYSYDVTMNLVKSFFDYVGYIRAQPEAQFHRFYTYWRRFTGETPPNMAKILSKMDAIKNPMKDVIRLLSEVPPLEHQYLLDIFDKFIIPENLVLVVTDPLFYQQKSLNPTQWHVVKDWGTWFRYEEIPEKELLHWNGSLRSYSLSPTFGRRKYFFPTIGRAQTYRPPEQAPELYDAKPLPLGVALWRGRRTELIKLVAKASSMGYTVPYIFSKDLPEYFEVQMEGRKIRVLHEQISSFKEAEGIVILKLESPMIEVSTTTELMIRVIMSGIIGTLAKPAQRYGITDESVEVILSSPKAIHIHLRGYSKFILERLKQIVKHFASFLEKKPENLDSVLTYGVNRKAFDWMLMSSSPKSVAALFLHRLLSTTHRDPLESLSLLMSNQVIDAQRTLTFLKLMMLSCNPKLVIVGDFPRFDASNLGYFIAKNLQFTNFDEARLPRMRATLFPSLATHIVMQGELEAHLRHINYTSFIAAYQILEPQNDGCAVESEIRTFIELMNQYLTAFFRYQWGLCYQASVSLFPYVRPQLVNTILVELRSNTHSARYLSHVYENEWKPEFRKYLVLYPYPMLQHQTKTQARFFLEYSPKLNYLHSRTEELARGQYAIFRTLRCGVNVARRAANTTTNLNRMIEIFDQYVSSESNQTRETFTLIERPQSVTSNRNNKADFTRKDRHYHRSKNDYQYSSYQKSSNQDSDEKYAWKSLTDKETVMGKIPDHKIRKKKYDLICNTATLCDAVMTKLKLAPVYAESYEGETRVKYQAKLGRRSAE